jgi:hypothetical protein
MKKHPVLKLKPTQFAVGMAEIDERIDQLEKLSRRSPKKLNDWLKQHPIPVVVSPRGHAFLVDHHHLLFICWYLGVRKVPIEVLHDLSTTKMTHDQFWKWMEKRGYYYAFCQCGHGPRKPVYLPLDIRGLADDPYRSLAWLVRKAGGFKHTNRMYAEFQWAHFFRTRHLLDSADPKRFQIALEKALRLTRSPLAQHLPGYLGKDSPVAKDAKQLALKISAAADRRRGIKE